MNNPFAVVTPESLAPKEIADLFVDVFSDFPKIKDPGHTFIHGPRGTGKSMMFRYLEPVVQNYATSLDLDKLQFFAIHVPVKDFDGNNDLHSIIPNDKLQNIIAENLLIFHCTKKIISGIKNSIHFFNVNIEDYDVMSLRNSINDLADLSGFDISNLSYLEGDPKNAFESIIDSLDEIIKREENLSKKFLKRVIINPSNEEVYKGSICSYLDFLVPLCETIKNLSFMPNKPIYLMIDDADNLPFIAQTILNSWVYSRTTKDVCLKISTQLNYQTYKTTSNFTIETPHDFSEVDISTVYTSNKRYYFNRVKDIVEKRLKLYGIEAKAEDFFETHKKQEEHIEAIKLQMRIDFDRGSARGGRRSDDSTRYARPEYMRRLSGAKRNSATYSYAGFKSIVDLSSGVIRNFLDLASIMFNIQSSRAKYNQQFKINCISHQIQDEAIYEWSERFMIEDFERLHRDENRDTVQKLNNLIQSLGQFFRHRIIDVEASERRLISIMVRQNLSRSTQEILNFGVRLGYLHTSTITDKVGLGRRRLYILNRRLAPYFKIDPSGYAAHLSVMEEDLMIAFDNPDRFVQSRTKNKPQTESLFDDLQKE